MAKGLVSKLKIVRSNFSSGTYAFCLLNRLKKEDVIVGNRVIIGEDGLYCVPRKKAIPPEAGKYYEVGFAGSKDFNLKKSNIEFSKMLLRNFTLDSFEIVRKYCIQTNQQNKLHLQPWYQFTRIMRNCLTHSRKLEFRPHDKKMLPVSWRNKIITKSMENKELSFEFYDWWDACELWEEMRTFSESLK